MKPDHESIRSQIDDALTAAPFSLEKAQEYVSQWQDAYFNEQLAHLRSNTDLQDTDILVNAAREAYIHKAASLYREIDMAVEQMEQAIANNVYYYSEQNINEAGNLSGAYPDNLQIVIGRDINDEPVIIDFNQLPHFISMSTGRNPIYDDVCNAILAKPDVRCLSIGSEICKYPQSLFPPALTSTDQEACLNWLKAEYEQRHALLKQDKKLLEGELGPIIFLFINSKDNEEILGSKIINSIAFNGKDLGFHLVIDAGDGLSIKDGYSTRRSRVTPDAVISLIDNYPNFFYISILELISIARHDGYAVYRLLCPGEFNIWITRYNSSSNQNDLKMENGLVPIYSDLGTQFAIEGKALKDALEERHRDKERREAHRRADAQFRKTNS